MKMELTETKTRRVYTLIRNRIFQGGYELGSLLPSTRELAKELGVSRALIVEVYEQLTAEGYLEGRQGSGTYVMDIGRSRPFLIQPEDSTTTDQLYFSKDSGDFNGIDFRPSFPALEHVPLQKWKRTALEVYDNAPSSAFGYQEDLSGSWPLRQSICQHLLKFKGFHCVPSQIIVTSGATQAISLLCKLLLKPKDIVAIEDPTAAFIHNIFVSTDAQIVPVPVDEHGLCVYNLPTHSQPKCIFVTPSHQFPSGSILSISRRIQLLDYARRTRSYIIEDDYDSEFRYGGMPIHALRELDSERVIYVGTFSKNLFPSLRLGYMVVPHELLEPLLELKRMADMQCPTLPQLTLAQFMKEGHLERHITRMKRIYGKRRKHLMAAMNEAFDGKVTISGDASGLHVVAKFPGRNIDLLTSMQLEEQHIRIYPAERYTISKEKYTESLIMGFGNVTELQITKGVKTITQFL